MSVVAPWAFALLALGLPLVLAYLHRRRRKVVRVSSALLFRAAAGTRTTTSRALARPRHLWSLCLALLGLLALVLALVDPRQAEQRPRTYVVVLDHSASMGTRSAGDTRTRLDEAREALAGALQGLGGNDRVALVATGARNAVLLGPTADHDKVLELAATLAPAGDSSRSAEGLAIADALALAHEATVVLVSDGVGVSIPRMRASFEAIEIGRAAPNLGLNAFGVREADALGLSELYFAVSSNVGQPRDVEIAIVVDERVIDVVPLDVPAHGRIESLHRMRLPPGERVRATLQQHGTDALDLDDAVEIPRRAGGRVSVLLVADSRLSFTAEALRLHPRVDLTLAGPNDTLPTDEVDLLVFEGSYRGPSPWPPSRHIVAMGVDPSTFGMTARGLVDAPEVLRWSFEDPLFRFVDLQEVEIPQAMVVSGVADGFSLVDVEGGPVATRTSHEGAEVVWFGFLPQQTDLVLRVGFVNLMANLVEWAAPIDGAAAGPGQALPATESDVDPPPHIPGARESGTFERSDPSAVLWWRWLALLGLLALVIETTLPWIASARDRIAARRRAKEAG